MSVASLKKVRCASTIKIKKDFYFVLSSTCSTFGIAEGTLVRQSKRKTNFSFALSLLNRTFATMNEYENIIVADADYVDKVAFNLIVNFERMLMRRIPPADMPRWIDCIALDGGMRPVEDGKSTQTHVVLVHDKGKDAMENFVPADFNKELNGKAFKDNLGEFTMSAVAVEDMVTKEEFFTDIIGTLAQEKATKRMMVIPNAEDEATIQQLRHVLKTVDDDKRITVFAMQPMPGGNFRQEILGYSLMNALGIKGEELRGCPQAP